jgi:hypothetical protein
MNLCSFASNLNLHICEVGPRCQSYRVRISSHTVGAFRPERFKRAQIQNDILVPLQFICSFEQCQ